MIIKTLLLLLLLLLWMASEVDRVFNIKDRPLFTATEPVYFVRDVNLESKSTSQSETQTAACGHLFLDKDSNSPIQSISRSRHSVSERSKLLKQNVAQCCCSIFQSISSRFIHLFCFV